MSETVKSVDSDLTVTFQASGDDLAYVVLKGTHVRLSADELREGLSTELDWTIIDNETLPEVRRLRGGEARYYVDGHSINTEVIDTPEKMLRVARRWIALAKHFEANPHVDPAQLLALSALIEDMRPLLGKSSAEVASELLKSRKINVQTEDS